MYTINLDMSGTCWYIDFAMCEIFNVALSQDPGRRQPSANVHRMENSWSIS